MKRIRFYNFGLVMLLLLGQLSAATATASQLSSESAEKSVFKFGQIRTKVVHKMGEKPTLKNLKFALSNAQFSVDQLDAELKNYMVVHSQSLWQRWSKSINIYEQQDRYSQKVANHLDRMSELFKVRRDYGSQLPHYYEFEFKTLINKSDYFVNVYATKESFKNETKNKVLAQRFHKSVYSYNEERLLFDARMVAWSE